MSLSDEFNTANYIYSTKETEDFGEKVDPFKRMRSDPAIMLAGLKDHGSIKNDPEEIIQECRNAAEISKRRQSDVDLSRKSMKTDSKTTRNDYKPNTAFEVLSQ